MRAVADTNVLLRGLIKPTGPSGLVLRRLRTREWTILHTRPLLAEVGDVLSRPRIATKYGLTPRETRALLRLVVLRGEAIVPSRQIQACRDPKDDKFLEAAWSGRADAIVSVDEDLLVLHPFEGIPIIGPAVFLTLLDSSPCD